MGFQEEDMRIIRAALLGIMALSAGTAGVSAQEKLVTATPTKAISFAPLYLAMDGGAFQKRGIEMSIVLLSGGTLPLTAMINGNAQFAALADDGLMDLASTGRVICVYSYVNSFTQNLQVRNAFLDSHKVTMDLTWQERVRRMKGITMGVLALGGSSDLAGRWLWKEAGLDYT